MEPEGLNTVDLPLAIGINELVLSMVHIQPKSTKPRR